MFIPVGFSAVQRNFSVFWWEKNVGCSLVVEPPGGDSDCFSDGASLVSHPELEEEENQLAGKRDTDQINKCTNK